MSVMLSVRCLVVVPSVLREIRLLRWRPKNASAPKVKRNKVVVLERAAEIKISPLLVLKDFPKTLLPEKITRNQ